MTITLFILLLFQTTTIDSLLSKSKDIDDAIITNKNYQEYNISDESIQSTEGSEVIAYTLDYKLHCVKAFIYGEMGKVEESYYYEGAEMYCYKEITYHYNMPMYLDSSEIVNTEEIVVLLENSKPFYGSKVDGSLMNEDDLINYEEKINLQSKGFLTRVLLSYGW